MKTIDQKLSKEKIDFVVPLLIGTFAFLLVVGPRVLDPTNIAWLEQGDPAMSYLGWRFFRSSEWFLPIGLNPSYGLEIGSSILFSDSNPLFAFLFKFVRVFISEPFQYFGIWLFVCFILQAWFSWKLMGLISKRSVIKILGVGIFIFAPPFLWRLYGHLNLLGHFFIIGALYLILHPQLEKRLLKWALLLTAAALTHPYILGMIALLWGSDSVGKIISNNISPRRAIIEICIIGFLVGISYWQVGCFNVGAEIDAGGFGFFRMNLMSVFQPIGWSYFLKDKPRGPGDYEGFNFLGSGVIFLVIFALPAMVHNHASLLKLIKRFYILFIVLCGFTVFALSNKIGFGGIEYEYPLPDTIIKIAGVFRASGRFFWPVFYMIIFTIIFIVVRGYKTKIASYLMLVTLFIQVMDTSAGWIPIRKQMMVEPASSWATSLIDPFWREAASKYKKVRWIPASNSSPHWKLIAAYAVTYNLATDVVYLARVDRSALDVAQHRSRIALASNQYENDSLYVLDDRSFREAALNNSSDHLLARIDGLNVLAPQWKKCATCRVFPKEVILKNLLPPAMLDQKILFDQSGSGPDYLLNGWFNPESWGTWSEGSTSSLLLPINNYKIKVISIEVIPLLNPPVYSQQELELTINGIRKEKIILAAVSDTQREKQTFKVEITDLIQQQIEKENFLKLDFYFLNSKRPKDMGINNDLRKLGFGLVSITLH